MQAATPAALALGGPAAHAGDAWRTIDTGLQRESVPEARALEDLLTLATQALGLRRALLALGDGEGLRIVAAVGEREVPVTVLAPDAGDADVHASDMPAGPQALLLDACGLRTCVRVQVRDRLGEPLGVLLIGDARRDTADAVDVDAARRVARLAGDLVERERLQRRTRISEQILQAGFAPLVVADGTGHVAFVNRAAAALLGTSARGLRGMPLTVLFPAHLQADADACAAWLSGQDAAAARTLHVGQAGAVRALDAMRCRWGTGDGQGVALVLRDAPAAGHG